MIFPTDTWKVVMQHLPPWLRGKTGCIPTSVKFAVPRAEVQVGCGIPNEPACLFDNQTLRTLQTKTKVSAFCIGKALPICPGCKPCWRRMIRFAVTVQVPREIFLSKPLLRRPLHINHNNISHPYVLQLSIETF